MRCHLYPAAFFRKKHKKKTKGKGRLTQAHWKLGINTEIVVVALVGYTFNDMEGNLSYYGCHAYVCHIMHIYVMLQKIS